MRHEIYYIEFRGEIIASIDEDRISSLLTELNLKYGRERVQKWIKTGKLKLRPVEDNKQVN